MVLWYTASASRSDTVLGRVEESRRTNIDVGIKLVYVRHDHSDAAGTCTTANASRLWRTVNAEISVPVAEKEIESSRPKRILRSGLHTVGDISVEFWVAVDHVLRRLPMRPSDFTLDRVCTWFVQITTSNGDAIAHGSPALLDVIKVARNRIDMNVTRCQPVFRGHPGREKPRV